MLPRLLILDDLFGRISREGSNVDRENLCAQFLWQDASGDPSAKASKQKILQPAAEAVFCRAQTPACSAIGDTVENDLESAMEAVRKGWPEALSARRGRPPKTPPPRWSMVLIDLCFYTGRVTEESPRRTPGMPEGRPGDDDPRSYFGLTLLDAIHREFPELPIFLLSSKPREEVSLEFSRRGALGFIDRSAHDGPELLEQALWHHGLLGDPSGEIVGQSLPLLLALREARRAAGQRDPILLRGERGTGKELLARYIHRASRQRPGGAGLKSGEAAEEFTVPSRFHTVGCGMIDRNLQSQELIGIQPRTAHGVDGRVGLIEMAKGGDLFLDEVSDLAPEVQAALPRIIETRQLTRVGGRESLPVEVRFLSSTSQSLENADPPFRPELLDRLRSGGTIWLPPLRDRKEDIPLLAAKFLAEAGREFGGNRRLQVTSEAMARLVEFRWNGNIRDLRTVLFDAVRRHPDNDYLVPQHLRFPSESDDEREAVATVSILRSPTHATKEHRSAREVIESLDRWQPDAADSTSWAGSLEALRTAAHRASARLLLAAIEANKRPTIDRPEGAILIHPAAKLATGNASLTASQAADLFKRVLGPLADELEGDLLEAYRISLRLRREGEVLRPSAVIARLLFPDNPREGSRCDTSSSPNPKPPPGHWARGWSFWGSGP